MATDAEPLELTRRVFDEYATRYWTLPDFLEEINQAAASIPEEKRKEALVSLEGDYEEASRFSISFEDVETPAEIAARLATDERYAREREERDRAEFERLKAKFSVVS